MAKPLTRRKIWVARIVAILLDAIQLGLGPLGMVFIDDGLDLIGAAFFIWYLGFHVAFLPTLAFEFVPGAQLFPFWTAAILFVTRGGVTPPPAAAAPASPPAGKVTDVTPVE